MVVDELVAKYKIDKSRIIMLQKDTLSFKKPQVEQKQKSQRNYSDDQFYVRVCQDEEDATIITEIVSKDSNDLKLLHGFAETLQVLMKSKMSVHEEYSFRGKQVTAIIAEGDISDGNLIQAMKNMLINPVNIEILPKEFK